MKTLPPIVEMESAYLRRDPGYEGIFVLGVRTTGVFCRPTCPARSPAPKNVEYFASAAEAVFAGYRPCKRCRPMEIANQPSWALELLAEVEADPTTRISEGDLRGRGFDPATVRRHFLKHYGMTFQAYARARRLAGAFAKIRGGESVDGAVAGSGYESHSGFRAAFSQTLGAAPTASRERGCVFLSWLQSPLGPLVAGAVDDGVCLLEFTDRRMLEAQFQAIRRHFRLPAIPGSNVHLERLREELDGYFAGEVRRFDVPLVYPGTPFQRRLWDALRAVPYGETRSYQQLAEAVGDPKAVRAAGRSNGLNRISILIPCHRIVNKNGGLGGYGGGLRRKQYLLDLERRHRAASCSEPK
jgi:AraC family transcriptional regulator of adaptative response/methylated-DNA-[protein]-cysteine methyltransferase